MGECKKGLYIKNTVITHFPIMCFGGFGLPQCDYLAECAEENGLVFRRNKWRLPTIRELKKQYGKEPIPNKECHRH